MQIAVTDVQTQIPALHHRRKLILQNTGSNEVYLGFETTTAATGANQGILLAAGAMLPLIFGGDIGLSNTVFLICSTGESTTVNYTQA